MRATHTKWCSDPHFSVPLRERAAHSELGRIFKKRTSVMHNLLILKALLDAVLVFEALEEAQDEASQVRGGMYWHAGPASSPQNQYLVRTTPAGVETSLGPRAPETEAIYERFTQRKRESTERVAGLKTAL